MNLYDSQARSPRPFHPHDEVVSLYVCGITPYDTTHLGHAFTYASIDVLVRYLEYRGRVVLYVQNVTDVDDDLLRTARERGEDWRALGDRWTSHYIRDMRRLNMRPPDHLPRASEAVEDMIAWIGRLLEVGAAYQSGEKLYFDLQAWPDYGRLSRYSPAEMTPLLAERGGDPDDPRKRGPLDFVLWQASADGEPAWPSPWGPGRPGWHIECSTLSTSILGETIDIHGGGADLIYPHHESEIAQVEAVTQKPPFVRFWMHVAMVEHEGQKMSKSLGNLVMLDELLRAASPDALRLYLARRHYRQVWSHDPAQLETAAALARSVGEALHAEPDEADRLDASSQRTAFGAAMDDDLDTATALDVLADLAAEINASGEGAAGARDELRRMARVFGLRVDSDLPEARVIQGWNSHLRRFEVNESAASAAA